MTRWRKRYWVLAVLAGLAFYAFYDPDVGNAPPTAIAGIDGSEAGLYDFFDKTCVHWRDKDWALARLRQNVDKCGWPRNSDCAEDHALWVEWLVKIKQGGVARVQLFRQQTGGTNWSVYDFGGKPVCSIYLPEAYGKALRQVPHHYRDLRSVQLSPKGMQLDELTHWRTSDNRLRFVLSHFKDNGEPEDAHPDKALDAVFDRQNAESEARPWELSEQP